MSLGTSGRFNIGQPTSFRPISILLLSMSFFVNLICCCVGVVSDTATGVGAGSDAGAGFVVFVPKNENIDFFFGASTDTESIAGFSPFLALYINSIKP